MRRLEFQFQSLIVWVSLSRIIFSFQGNASCVDQCEICRLLNTTSTPKLYVTQRHDGHGGAMTQVLGALLLVDKLGLTYGGALGHRHQLSFNHNNEDMDKSAKFILGSSSKTIHDRDPSKFPLNKSLLCDEIHQLGNGIVTKYSRDSNVPCLYKYYQSSVSHINGLNDSGDEDIEEVWIQKLLPPYEHHHLAVRMYPVGKEDSLFHKRRVLLVRGDGILTVKMDSLLLYLARPYVFDDLVLFTWDVFAVKQKHTPTEKMVMSSEFLARYRRGAACEQSLVHTNYFKSNRTSVAIHLRRGDVTAMNDHFTKDSEFLNIIHTIRSTDNESDIHIFSTTERRCTDNLRTMQGCLTHGHCSNTSFQQFENIGVMIHIDGDFLVDWSHFIRADIFVMSKSAFSNIAAFFNPNCVIWQFSPWTPLRLSDWIIRRSETNNARRLVIPRSCFKSTTSTSSSIISDKRVLKQPY